MADLFGGALIVSVSTTATIAATIAIAANSATHRRRVLIPPTLKQSSQYLKYTRRAIRVPQLPCGFCRRYAAKTQHVPHRSTPIIGPREAQRA